MNLPKKQAAALAAMLENIAVEPRASLFAFGFATLQTQVSVAAAEVRGHPGTWLVFTLAAASPHVFATVTDGDPEKVADILARIEEQDASSGPLRMDDSLAIDNEYLRRNGRRAALIFTAGIAPLLAHLNDRVSFDAQEHHLLYVLFLSEPEYELKKAKGLGALLSKFDIERRDTVRIASETFH